MKIKEVNYETGLEFVDVQEFIPTITVDNEVVTDGEIVRFELVLNDNEKQNIFLDLGTTEYCYNSKYNLDYVSDLIQSHFFKYRTKLDFLSNIDESFLIEDILAEEV